MVLGQVWVRVHCSAPVEQRHICRPSAHVGIRQQIGNPAAEEARKYGRQPLGSAPQGSPGRASSSSSPSAGVAGKPLEVHVKPGKQYGRSRRNRHPCQKCSSCHVAFQCHAAPGQARPCHAVD